MLKSVRANMMRWARLQPGRHASRSALALGLAAAVVVLGCAPLAPGPASTPEPWPTAPQPRRTPLPLPEPTVAPPTAVPTATRGPADFVGRQRARVLRVWDGQSILIENGMTVRYLGVHAPSAGTFGRPTAPGGIAAAQRNAELVEGKEVELEQDVTDIDAEGQLPRYVWVDGEMVNKDLLAAGLAQAAVREPDLRHAETLLAAEREAWEARRGLWANAPTMTRTPIVRQRATLRPTPPPPPTPTPDDPSRQSAPPFGGAPATRQPGPAPAATPAGPTAVATTAPGATAAPPEVAPSPAIPRFGE